MTDPESLYGYLAGQFADADLAGQTDEQAAIDGLRPETRAAYEDVLAAGRELLSAPAFDWKKIADHANRRLLNEQEARQWLTHMMDIVEDALKTT